MWQITRTPRSRVCDLKWSHVQHLLWKCDLRGNIVKGTVSQLFRDVKLYRLMFPSLWQWDAHCFRLIHFRRPRPFLMRFQMCRNHKRNWKTFAFYAKLEGQSRVWFGKFSGPTHGCRSVMDWIFYGITFESDGFWWPNFFLNWS